MKSRSVVVKQLIRCRGLIHRDRKKDFTPPVIVRVYADIKLCFVVMAVVRLVVLGCLGYIGKSFEIAGNDI